MNYSHNIFLTMAVAAMFSLFLFIFYGDNGLGDLNIMKQSRDSLKQKNQALIQKNLSLYRSIERLRNDPDYIENVARQELGLVGKGEIIFKIAETETKEQNSGQK